MSPRLAYVACRFALILAPAGAWLTSGVPVDAEIAGHLDAEPRLLNLSAPDRVFGKGECYDRQVADFGLDPPRAHVTVVALDGAMTSIAFGDATPTRVTQYMRVVWSDAVITITSSEAAHLSRLIELAGNAS